MVEIFKIKTPYGTKNWPYIKRLMDRDTEGWDINAEWVEIAVSIEHQCPVNIDRAADDDLVVISLSVKTVRKLRSIIAKLKCK